MLDWKVREEAEPVFTTDMWYDVLDGGYVEPEKFLADEETIDQVNKAMLILQSYVTVLIDNGKLEVG